MTGKILRTLGVVVVGLVLLGAGWATGYHYRIPIISPKSRDFGLEHRYTVRDRHFRQTLDNLLGDAPIGGNQIELLRNGDEIFPAMLDAIASAEQSITFEMFVFADGKVSESFCEAFAERAEAGVPVHLILDWVGAKALPDKRIEKMLEAGVDVRFYQPLAWYNPVRWLDLDHIDSRTHRKLMVIDGKLGFTGGVGIADQWQGNARTPKEWRDDHFRIRGPLVAQMQAAFIDNWLEAGGDLIDGDRYFPALQAVGKSEAQAFNASPNETTELIELAYRLAITAATDRIRIATPYLVLNEATHAAFLEAAERGVKIQIIVPNHHSDSALSRHSSRASWGDFLRAGIEIYEYQPTMYHTKLMVVDDFFSSIGSANFDNRSFHLNDETNVNVLDAEFAQIAIEDFERDLQKAKQVTLEAWENRPLWNRIVEAVGWAVRSEL